MISYFSGFFSFTFLIWVVSKGGLYNTHYIERSLKFQQAKFLLSSTACTDPERRVILSQSCTEAVKILYTKPYIAAIFDTADDLQLPYVVNLHKIIVGFILLAVVVLYASGIQIRRDRQENHLNQWRLPIKVDHID